MVPGYNHNVKYKGKIYHVQTEDSGFDYSHIITHLFIGGNIIKTEKSDYQEHKGHPELENVVTELMQDQHKEMLKALIKGQLDERLEKFSVNAAHLDGPAPLNVDAGSQHKASLGFTGDIKAGTNGGDSAQPASIPKPGAVVAKPTPKYIESPEPEFVIEAEDLQRAFDSRDEKAVASIFGSDLISEQSLDAVILSYLADDIQKGA